MADIETTPHGEPKVTPGLEPVVVKEVNKKKTFNPAWRSLVIPLLAGAVIFLAGLLVGLAIPTHGHGDFNGPGHGKDNSYVFQEGERSFGDRSNRGERPNGPAERGERSETEVGPSVQGPSVQGPQDNPSTDDRTDENNDDNVDPSEETQPSVESE
jgi:hypothetical protein